jgi:hypothetical protein
MSDNYDNYPSQYYRPEKPRPWRVDPSRPVGVDQATDLRAFHHKKVDAMVAKLSTAMSARCPQRTLFRAHSPARYFGRTRRQS